MRKPILIIFLTLHILSVFGQNGIKAGNYFLLLSNKKSISLNTFENNNLNVIKTFEITEKSIYTTDQNTRVAILDTSTNNVLLYDFQSRKELKLDIPFKLNVKSILLNNDNLFVGGEMDKEMLVQYHIKSNKWFSLEIPTEVRFPRKAIDDLLINDGLLIAIDDIVLPKYILFYSLNDTGKLSLSHIKDLKSNGPYESIFKGKITSKYLGLISESYSGYIGPYEHITIYEGLDLKKSFSIETSKGNLDDRIFKDIAIIDDKVYIASKDNGFGVFEIKDSYFKVSKDKYDRYNVNVDASIINYRPYENSEIIGLTIVPNNSKIILTIINDLEKISYEIIDI